MHRRMKSLALLIACSVPTSSGFVTLPGPSWHLSRKFQTRSRQTSLAVVLSSPLSRNATTAASLTSTAKYPTARGSEVDARKIIATGAGRQHLTAIRLAHILFASRELAEASLHQLRSSAISFETLAQQISNCDATRHKGGALGWMNIPRNPQNTNEEPLALGGFKNQQWQPDTHTTSGSSGTDEHLDALFPREARDQIVQITTKPGDIVLVQSSLGFHLVQVVDVMADVRQMAVKRPKRTFGHAPPEKESPKRIKTYQLETMGCQMNAADSERMEGQLQNLGYRPYQQQHHHKYQQKPDLIVLNTCSIRDHAEQKVYSYVGPHAKRKREGEDVTIVVAGCVAQQEGEALLRRSPEIDLVMGPQYANRIGDLLEDVANGNQVLATEATHIMEDSTKPRRQSTVCAWVNAIYGCNERCTFCIVPTTRGVEQSRPVESIVQEVEELVQQGYKEVTLLGQNIDAYGRDMIPKRKFSDLLRTVGTIPGLERLRFVTSHPRYMSLGVVDAVAETPAACESFHIPFQSGSNEVLAAMGRGHTREKYLHIIDRIRSKLPDASITADVIVGFPGETEEQFQETLSLMKEVVFDNVNTAAYSPRPNTPAAFWENQVSECEKENRLNRINKLNLEHAAKRRGRLLGRTVEILVEQRNVKKPSQVMGRSRHGFIVYCNGDIDELRGKLVHVNIDTAQTYFLAGTIVEG